MPRSTYYVQECPTCGRSLQVRVEYLGKQVVCQHCGAQFAACEHGSSDAPPADSALSLLERADELIESASVHMRDMQVRGSSGLTATAVRPK